MLSMLEQVVLLAVDEQTGYLESPRAFGMAYALAGAVFFDLALARKIDTDTDEIRILDSNPSRNPIWDRVLSRMREHPEIRTVRDWIEALFRSNDDLEGEALASLIAQGILRLEKSKRFWIIGVERFPLVDGLPRNHVRERLARAILADDIPDTRDIMLVSIAGQCGLLPFVLSETQLAARRERIAVLSNLETISRKVSAAIAGLDSSLRQAPLRLG